MHPEIKKLIETQHKRLESLFIKEIKGNVGFAKPRIVFMCKTEKLIGPPINISVDIVHVQKNEFYHLTNARFIDDMLVNHNLYNKVKLKSFVENECKILQESGKEVVGIFYFSIMEMTNLVFTDNDCHQILNAKDNSNKMKVVISILDLPSDRITRIYEINHSKKMVENLAIGEPLPVNQQVSEKFIERIFPVLNSKDSGEIIFAQNLVTQS